MSLKMSKTTSLITPKVLTLNTKEKLGRNKTRAGESNVINVKALDTFKMNALIFSGNKRTDIPPPFLMMSQMRIVKLNKPTMCCFHNLHKVKINYG